MPSPGASPLPQETSEPPAPEAGDRDRAAIPPSLQAVADALLGDARRRADELEAAAERDAGAVLASARAEAERLTAAARATGRTEGERASAVKAARGRRRAREAVLGARRGAYDRFLEQSRAAASALVTTPAYPGLLEGLRHLCLRQLGGPGGDAPGAAPGVTASVVFTEPPEGGVTARLGDRSVDYRLPAIAERCVAAMGADIEALWR